jgi:hypothetical protein
VCFVVIDDAETSHGLQHRSSTDGGIDGYPRNRGPL